MSLIRATILTGFLGSGKTTLLKRVLSEAHDMKIAVIENEFGEENIDNEILVTEQVENIIQMSNGCICCTIREDLRSTLVDLAQKKWSGELEFDRVIIETTGLADPGPVVQTFFLDEEVAEQYLLDAVLTVVDANHAARQLNERQEARRQVGFADQIFISKADLVNSDSIEALRERLARINPRAPISTACFGDVPLKLVFDLRGFTLNERLELSAAPFNLSRQVRPDHFGIRKDNAQHINHHDDVSSFVYRAELPFDPVRLRSSLDALVQEYGPKMLRYKGVLDMKGSSRKIIFQGVHQFMSDAPGANWDTDEPRISKMVFIGVDLPRNLFEKELDAALA